MTSIAIGRLLRANTAGCVIGCRVSQQDAPTFGQMVRIPLDDGSQLFGLVQEIHIDDDGLVRQLVTAPDISEEIIEDNRVNRNMPMEISVAFIGWEKEHTISQTRAPRPPLSLDQIFLCNDAEIAAFTSNGKFGYFRSLVRNEELPTADLLTAHLRQIHYVHKKLMTDLDVENSVREIIALLKDDYPQLMDVLSAVSEIL
ncbi:MAG: hypothetical protein FD147_2502 [Chloroflexi bacterium]|nr:MAG: hypothetical protein FD147_2502 [Chloroflexota bacterium]MBA4376060.1 hypothetical protein [Anaerolinea sp.]